MRPTSRRQLWTIVLLVAAMVLVWLVARAAQGGSGTDPGARSSPGPSVTATAGAEGTQRHTASGSGSAEATDPVSGLRWVDESALPPEAHDTLALIRAGGPFPYPRNDNQTFGNREGLLPREPRRYYREFTVVTPGESDRGPRRIITGSDGEAYWTDDHYATFSRIREGS